MAYKKEDKDRIFGEICDNIANGMSLRRSIDEVDTIDITTFYEWLDEDKEVKSQQYARACNLRADAKFESIESDYMEQPERDPETGKIDTGWVQLQRLKIDSKKWESSKLNPKKYGDKIETTHAGSIDIKTITFE